MTANPCDTAENITATVELSVAGKGLRLEISVPTGPTPSTRMLPVFRSLSESFVNRAVERIQDEGFEVSCKKGCGACCRQLVPIAEVDARRLSEWVNQMPGPRKAEIVARFEDAKRRMQQAGLLDRLREPEKISEEEFKAFGLEYFHQGVACPFLEDESCSIHAERPLVCREYLVVSPPANCDRLNGEPVQVLKIPAQVSRAARYLNAAEGGPPDRWIPLILALEWVDAHPEESPPRAGTELLRELFSGLSEKEIPKAEV
jgi:Fe-S-cluster containining protein